MRMMKHTESHPFTTEQVPANGRTDQQQEPATEAENGFRRNGRRNH